MLQHGNVIFFVSLHLIIYFNYIIFLFCSEFIFIVFIVMYFCLGESVSGSFVSQGFLRSQKAASVWFPAARLFLDVGLWLKEPNGLINVQAGGEAQCNLLVSALNLVEVFSFFTFRRSCLTLLFPVKCKNNIHSARIYLKNHKQKGVCR